MKNIPNLLRALKSSFEDIIIQSNDDSLRDIDESLRVVVVDVDLVGDLVCRKWTKKYRNSADWVPGSQIEHKKTVIASGKAISIKRYVHFGAGTEYPI